LGHYDPIFSLRKNQSVGAHNISSSAKIPKNAQEIMGVTRVPLTSFFALQSRSALQQGPNGKLTRHGNGSTLAPALE
jgi:hypothetical protein